MFTKMRNVKKILIGSAVAILLAGAMMFSSIGTPIGASALSLEKKGMYFADFSSYDETLAAANALNEELSAEGDVLLKNDGLLPFNGREKISVFGVKQDSIEGGSGNIATVLENEGFNVNPALKAYYGSVGATIGNENVNGLSSTAKQSVDLYDDAAVVILSRTGSEGNDPARITNEIEDNKDGNGQDYGWEHEALGHKGSFSYNEDPEKTGFQISDEDNYYKHYLELTNSEEELLAFVKSKFDKVVVLLNTSNAMEMANLEEDPGISAILWIGRPGSTGINVLGKILNGKLNPSGKLVDEWNRDFTADPTWQNFGTCDQVGGGYDYIYNQNTTEIPGVPAQAYSLGTISGEGFKGIDYDEDIYLGYRYFETVYAEMVAGNLFFNKTTKKIVKLEPAAADLGTADEWWEYAVVYPFGFGLSYTEFNQSFDSLYYYNGEGEKTELTGTIDGSIFASSEGNPQQVKKLYADVTVDNTGLIAGKQVVQVYATLPYTAGKIEKAAIDLVGYAKTGIIAPGGSQKVTVEFNVQDFASFDYNDANENGKSVYELDAGEYSIKIMEDSHRVIDEKTFTLSATVCQELDDFSDNPVDNVFSKGDYFDTVRKFQAGEGKLNFNTSADGDMVLLKRADLSSDTVQGLRPTVATRTMSDDYVKSVVFFNDYTQTKPLKFLDSQDTTTITGAAHFTWYKTEEELKTLMAGWTQAASYANDYVAPIQLRDMSGIADDDTVYQNTDADAANYTTVEAFNGKKGSECWVLFMNQLRWSDIQNIDNHGSHTTAAIPAIGKVASKDENGPNSFCGKSWCDSVVLASTWNVKLAKQYGIINANLGMFNSTTQTGWYGPGINNHRSPFGGRNNEYYSQDGIQGGYIGAAQVAGAQSRGLNVFVKHIFMNDQEAARSKQCLFAWASEAAMRLIYAKPFQMAMQEGGATSAMCAYNRLGGITTVYNSRFLTDLVRKEWGWIGEYVTDYYGNGQISANNMDLLVRAGCDLPDGTASSAVDALSGTWDAEKVGVGTAEAKSGNVVLTGEDGTAETPATMVESLTQWYYGRTAAQRVLLVAANTLNNYNGVNKNAYTYPEAYSLTQAVAANGVSIAKPADQLNGNTVKYELSSGTLPAGLSLNASTGAITGTPTEVGTFRITVKALAAGWISSNVTATLNVASAFTLKNSEDEIITSVNGTVGSEVYAALGSTVVTTTAYPLGITYSATGLPAGVTMNAAGEIEGTPTEAGSFTAAVTVTCKSGNSRRPTTTIINTTVSLVIAEGEGGTPAPVDHGGITGIEKTGTEGLVDTYTITYADGATETFTVTNGADGAKGDKGDTGAAGAKGDKGDKGDTGATGAAGADGKDACSSSVSLAGFMAIFAAALIAVAVKVFKRKED